MSAVLACRPIRAAMCRPRCFRATEMNRELLAFRQGVSSRTALPTAGAGINGSSASDDMDMTPAPGARDILGEGRLTRTNASTSPKTPDIREGMLFGGQDTQVHGGMHGMPSWRVGRHITERRFLG